jgi:integration host factor subunit beta
MTKADLVEEVTKLGDLTRRDSETIVETIFDSATRSKSADSGASASGNANRASGAIRKPAPRLRFPQRRFRISSPAKNCATW